MIDIDHFKKFNDSYGHQVGDQVLRLVAKIMQDSVRDVDLAARYGGEEMMAVLPGADLGLCADVAERIRCRISEARLTRRSTDRSGDCKCHCLDWRCAIPVGGRRGGDDRAMRPCPISGETVRPQSHRHGKRHRRQDCCRLILVGFGLTKHFAPEVRRRLQSKFRQHLSPSAHLQRK
jgi:Diguanylate cyclase, GGDEF domain